MASNQQKHSAGVLLERMGILEITLALRVADGGLEYESHGVALRLFGLSLPLPRWLAPKVTASEKPATNDHDVMVSVETHLPWLGLLVGYSGMLTVMEDAR